MSAPAAKARSLPPSTIARTASSRSSSRECGDELVHQLVGERVQRLGPVEQDDRDCAVALDLDQAHFFSRNFSIAAFGSSVAIDNASQSRAWLIVSCHAKSFQKFRCCFA